MGLQDWQAGFQYIQSCSFLLSYKNENSPTPLTGLRRVLRLAQEPAQRQEWSRKFVILLVVGEEERAVLDVLKACWQANGYKCNALQLVNWSAM